MASPFAKWRPSEKYEREYWTRKRRSPGLGRILFGRPEPKAEPCVACRNPIDDEGLCVNKRCRRSKPEGQVGTGWAKHPNARR